MTHSTDWNVPPRRVVLELTPLEASDLEIALFDWLHTANCTPVGLKSAVFPIAQSLRDSLTAHVADVAVERFGAWYGSGS